MTSYAELKVQIAELERQAARARQHELIAAVEQIRTIMRDYGISLEELTQDVSMEGKRKRAVAPKYRDPATGATWSGRGRTPRWLEGKSKSDYSVTP